MPAIINRYVVFCFIRKSFKNEMMNGDTKNRIGYNRVQYRIKAKGGSIALLYKYNHYFSLFIINLLKSNVYFEADKKLLTVGLFQDAYDANTKPLYAFDTLVFANATC